jgi:hypothetical protein
MNELKLDQQPEDEAAQLGYTEFGTPQAHAEMVEAEEAETTKVKRKIGELAEKQKNREGLLNFKDISLDRFRYLGMMAGAISVPFAVLLGGNSLIAGAGTGLGMMAGSSLYFLKEQYYRRKNGK